MSLTAEQYRDKDVYEKLAVEAGRRIKPGEEKIWEVLPYDPTSSYHQLSPVYFEPILGVQTEDIKKLMTFALANYKPENVDTAAENLEGIIEGFRPTGELIRDIFKAGEHVAINVDHQSRFSPLLTSEFVQLGATEDIHERDTIKSRCSTIVTKYLGCYGINLSEALGVPDLPTVNAFEAARNLSGLIPIFPDTEIKNSSGIDPKIQEEYNARAIFASRPKKGVPEIRTFCASAASDQLLKSGGYRMRAIDHKIKRLFRMGGWHIISVATNIDPDDPTKNFFIPSEITPADEYTMDTLDEHNLWIAQKRTELTGQPVVYEPAVA